MENKPILMGEYIPLKINFPQSLVVYSLKIISSTNILGREEKADYEVTTTIHYANDAQYQRICIIRFESPVFKEENNYTKEQWLYSKLFTVNSNLILHIDESGRIIKVLNKKRIIDNLSALKQEFLSSQYKEAHETIQMLNTMKKNLEERFQQAYMEDTILQWLCNDIFFDYKLVEKKYPINKKLIGHFGWTPVSVTENKWIKMKDNRHLIIYTESSLNKEELNIPAINAYLYNYIREQRKLNYHFSCDGYYEYSTENNCIEEAKYFMHGNMENVYEKTLSLHLKLKQISNG